MFHETESGTPQGGIISPLLANIALHGLEELVTQFKETRITEYTERKTGKRRKKKKEYNRYGIIRYADDYIITAKTKEDIEAIIPIVEEWLRERGLTLNKEKTNVTHIGKGFDFLGFTLRQHQGKTLCFPEKEKVLSKLREIRAWLKKNPSATPEKVIGYLNPIIRGIGNFYKTGVSKAAMKYFDAQIWKALWKWARRRHENPYKGARWVRKKYFRTNQGTDWTFFAKVQDRRHGKPKYIHLTRAGSIPIERHVKVKDISSPDDPTLAVYWKDRKTKYGKSYWTDGKYRKVAERQKWKCPVCSEHLFNGEELETHHIVKVKDGGTNDMDNLVHLHKACHRHIHSGKQKKQEA